MINYFRERFNNASDDTDEKITNVLEKAGSALNYHHKNLNGGKIMKRDVDLIRKILFYVEETYVAGGPEISVHIDGYSASVVYEHCILMHNDRLIGKILDTSTLEARSCLVGNLTSDGFDLLEKIRADTVWNRTKSEIVEKGLPFVTETIKMIATAIITATAEGVTNSILKSKGLV